MSTLKFLGTACLWFIQCLAAQGQDFTWPAGIETVEIISSHDGTIQRALFRPAVGERSMPLIVSLHTWSGNYEQDDSLVFEAVRRDWNYVHPDFRGQNVNPEACCSPKAIADIEDAITFAIQNSPAPPNAIHVTGASGGGMATLCAFMNTRHQIASFVSWVPITDLRAWYYESLARGNKYAGDIMKCTSSTTSDIDVSEAKMRSPLYMDYPMEERAGSQLTILAGIHDGYTGSVPITQSILFYNRIAGESGAHHQSLVSDHDIIELLTKRSFPGSDFGVLGNRKIHYLRSAGNISLIIFEGTHEKLPSVTFQLLEE